MYDIDWDDDACDEIIPNLYISGFMPPGDLDRLKKLGITHIVNLSSYDNNFHGEFTYLRIVVDDFPESRIRPHLDKAVEFVENSLKEGRVLVHCNMGMSRAGSVIVAYLVKNKKMTVDGAVAFASKQRPQNYILPNEGFMKQLLDYEKTLKEQKQ